VPTEIRSLQLRPEADGGEGEKGGGEGERNSDKN